MPKGTSPFTLVSVGGGLRGAYLARSIIVFLYGVRDIVTQIPGFRFRLIVVDRQDAQELAGGRAFNSSSTGMINTSLFPDLNYPVGDFSGPQAQFLKQSRSLRTRSIEKFGSNENKWFHRMAKTNLPGALMYKRAMSSASWSEKGKLDVGQACLMRNLVGETERENINQLVGFAKKHLPFFELFLETSTEVNHVDINDPKQPKIYARKLSAKEGQHSVIAADNVILNTGTTWENPIQEKDVKQHTYSQEMNPGDLKTFLQRKGGIGKDGKLKKNFKVVIGGVQVSLFDALSALVSEDIMDVFEEDENSVGNYRVKKEAAVKYKNSISIISRHKGVLAEPRLCHSGAWKAAANPIGNTEQFHALGLDGFGQRQMDEWSLIKNAAVARAMKIAPDQVDPQAPQIGTFELAKQYYEECKYHLEHVELAGAAADNNDSKTAEHELTKATLTRSGIARAAAISVEDGHGFERNPDLAIERVSKKAPHTFKGRQGNGIHYRSMVHGFTMPQFATKISNVHFNEKWGRHAQTLQASPVVIQIMLHKLVEAGIIDRHIEGNYKDISPSSSGGLKIKDYGFSVLVVSPTFRHEKETAITSLKDQIKPISPQRPYVPAVGKFRRIISKKGVSTNVEDHGMGGRGGWITLPDGSRSLLGVYAQDLNCGPAVSKMAGSLAIRMTATAMLHSARVRNSPGEVVKIYENSLPSERRFKAEVASFKPQFVEAMEIGYFVKMISSVSKSDGKKFAEYYDRGETTEERKSLALELVRRGSSSEKLAGNKYLSDCKEMPPFCPISQETFESRCVDATEEQDLAIFQEAARIAKNNQKSKYWGSLVMNF